MMHAWLLVCKSGPFGGWFDASVHVCLSMQCKLFLTISYVFPYFYKFMFMSWKWFGVEYVHCKCDWHAEWIFVVKFVV